MTSARGSHEHAPTRSFGRTTHGEEATLFTLENKNGLRAAITDFGAALVEMWVPDRCGQLADVVLGFDTVAGYESDDNQYFGCTTGRVANRIAGGRFSLQGRDYSLLVNNGPNHLHGGGERALSRVLWKGAIVSEEAVAFRYLSPAGEEGYPGNLAIKVVYTLSDANELRIDYHATSDAPTPVNLTNHAYWNLNGHGSATATDHLLSLQSNSYTPTDATSIPTGEISTVVGTAFDFRSTKRVDRDLESVAATAAAGYDHNFVIEGVAGLLREAAVLCHQGSGRTLQLFTTEPAVQFYSGNHLKYQRGKKGAVYSPRSALCLEAQHYPDAVHHAHFPSVILLPGNEYRQTTVHRFTVR